MTTSFALFFFFFIYGNDFLRANVFEPVVDVTKHVFPVVFAACGLERSVICISQEDAYSIIRM